VSKPVRFLFVIALLVMPLVMTSRAFVWESCDAYCDDCPANKIQPCETCIGEDADGYTYIKWWCGSCGYMC